MSWNCCAKRTRS